MTLNQLRYFCAAARSHSISQAARDMFVSQPTVSIAIKELEKEFSITLFSFSKNTLSLTGEGEIFYQRASALLSMSDDMTVQFSDPSRLRPTVRLGFPPLISTLLFPELMDAFHEEHPEIYLELTEYGSRRASSMVQEDQIDLALVNMEQYNIDKFSCLPLLNENLIFCVSPDHPMANENRITLPMLHQQPIILFNNDSAQNKLLMERFHALSIQPRIIMECSQIMTMLKFIRTGKSGCFFFSSMLSLLPGVTGIPVEPEIPMKIGLIWKKGKYLSSNTQTFIQFCKQYFTH